MKNACTFYIVRHGQTEWNISQRLQGQADSPLTHEGLRQINKLAKEFKTIHFDEVFSSDALRALRTAEIITLEREIAIKTTELLRERSFGKYEGKKFHEFEEELRDIHKAFEKLTDTEKMPFKFDTDIESDEEIVSRFITFLRETAIAYPGKNILIVSHGSMMRILLLHLGFSTYAQLPHHSVKNTAYIVLESNGVEFMVKQTNGITLAS